MLEVEPTYSWLPRWSTYSFKRTKGRYPLGLEAVAMAQLEADLASGLPVVSQHPRYWSIYTYIVKRFWDTGRMPQTQQALGRYLRRREVVFAAAALECPRHPELSGVLGQQVIKTWLNQHPGQPLPVDLVYLQNARGGYGQVYRGAMGNLGIILLSEYNHQVKMDAPWGDLGASLAEAFRTAVADTAYVREYIDRDDVEAVPRDVIRELAGASCFCGLGEHPTERDLLTDILMGRAQPKGQLHEPTHHKRASTVRMFLDLAKVTDTHTVDEGRFRQLIYYGTDWDGWHWDPAPSVLRTRKLWRLVQLRDFVVSALSSLYINLVRWGVDHGGTLTPASPAEYYERLLEIPFPDGLDLDIANLPLRSIKLKEVAGALEGAIRTDGWPVIAEAVRAPHSELSLLMRTNWGGTADAPVVALLALLTAQRRYKFAVEQEEPSLDEERLLKDGGVDRLSTAYVFDWLQQRIEQDVTIAQAVIELTREMVILQHLRTARNKLPYLDTFRFHDESGRLRFVDFGDWGVAPVSIRFDAVDVALADLGLIVAPMTEPAHSLTGRGEAELHGQ